MSKIGIHVEGLEDSDVSGNKVYGFERGIVIQGGARMTVNANEVRERVQLDVKALREQFGIPAGAAPDEVFAEFLRCLVAGGGANSPVQVEAAAKESTLASFLTMGSNLAGIAANVATFFGTPAGLQLLENARKVFGT